MLCPSRPSTGTSCAPFLSGLMSEAIVSTLILLLLLLLILRASASPSPSLVLSYSPEKGFEGRAWWWWPQGIPTSLAGDAHAALRSSCSPPAELKHLAHGHTGGACAGLALASWLLWYDARMPKTILEFYCGTFRW